MHHPMKQAQGTTLAHLLTSPCPFPSTLSTQSFNRRNLNCSTEDSLRRFAEVARTALDAGLAVRGYVSVAMGCPYEGRVEPREAAAVVKAVLDMGCYEVRHWMVLRAAAGWLLQ